MTEIDLDPEYLARMGEPPSSIAYLRQRQAERAEHQDDRQEDAPPCPHSRL